MTSSTENNENWVGESSIEDRFNSLAISSIFSSHTSTPSSNHPLTHERARSSAFAPPDDISGKKKRKPSQTKVQKYKGGLAQIERDVQSRPAVSRRYPSSFISSRLKITKQEPVMAANPLTLPIWHGGKNNAA